MKHYFYNKLSEDELSALAKRPAVHFKEIFNVVQPILNDIKSNGLNAAVKYAEKFDGFQNSNLLATEKDFKEAEKNLDKKIKNAIEKAAKNIRKYHKEQFPYSYEIETMKGICCSREYRAIENVGLYVPGGSAVLPSTILMLGIPARIAGCKRIAVCTPAKDGKINYPLLYAAKVSGVREIYKLGGAQAIGFMAYGDKKIPKVDKIFGPGNQYVTAAKLLVSIDPDGCAIDLPAGPSEVLVIADDKADPSFVAADLLSQAEHGIDSQVVLLSNSEKAINKINIELRKQLGLLPRKNLAEKALENSFALITENIGQAVDFSNKYAPEHLIINVKHPEKYKSKIQNAGSVFLGPYSPESAGDYASGTNHSLPTSGYAKTFGGVTVESFMKPVSFQMLTKKGLKNISSAIETLAEVEGLDAHKNAVSIRLKKSTN